jgi:hypothetical protein
MLFIGSYSRYPLQYFLFLKKKQKRISTAIGARNSNSKEISEKALKCSASSRQKK